MRVAGKPRLEPGELVTLHLDEGDLPEARPLMPGACLRFKAGDEMWTGQIRFCLMEGDMTGPSLSPFAACPASLVVELAGPEDARSEP